MLQEIYGQIILLTLLIKKCNTKLKHILVTVKFRFGGRQIIKPLYVIEIPILLAGEQITVKFDVVDSDIPLFLRKNNMKQWNLTIITAKDTAELIVNDKLKKVELYTSAKGQQHVTIQLCFPINVMSVLLSVKKNNKKTESPSS